MAHVHECNLTQLSQILIQLFFFFFFLAQIYRRHVNRWGPAPAARSLPRSSSRCQRALTEVTSFRASQRPTCLNQGPSEIRIISRVAASNSK